MGSIYERGYNQRLYHNRAADSTAMGAKEVQARVSPASRHSRCTGRAPEGDWQDSDVIGRTDSMG